MKTLKIFSIVTFLFVTLSCEKKNEALISFIIIDGIDSTAIVNMEVVHQDYLTSDEVFFSTRTDKNGFANVLIENYKEGKQYSFTVNPNRDYPFQEDTSYSENGFYYASGGRFLFTDEFNDTHTICIYRVPIPDNLAE